ncbi:MAG: prolyl-tRNA synthetase [Candidatus Buchananbacteria bacterium]|nr:prolyl-tRNA synthetase [Candidatus Buchananbacteria bacterium]
MRQSFLLTKTKKQIEGDEKSLNAVLLIRAGFIDKLTTGVYTYLPLGLKVLAKIENIIRQEMNEIGGQEILMPALTPKQNWEKTNRWEGFDALFKLQGHDNKEYALGATHEEVVTPLVKKNIFSYKDLPKYIYQIQDKFRNEPRAKSGLLRGREFLMKDLYSFHKDEADLNNYYQKVKLSYFKIFKRLGLKDLTYWTFASGGVFTKYSHEFQTLADNGEDIIYICENCNLAYNKEIITEIKECEECKASKDKFKEAKAIETGNIFKLGNRFSKDFAFNYIDENGQKKDIVMGCYGIGLSRIMGTLVEVNNDAKGIIWPVSVAPYQVHLLALSDNKRLIKKSEDIYNELTQSGYEVLFDDRLESPGIKLNDADLIGLPVRLVISDKTLKQASVELKKRSNDNIELIKFEKVVKYLNDNLK